MYAFNGLWPFLSLALICRLYMANRLCIRQLVSDRTSIFTYLQGSAYNTIYARKCKCKSSTPLLFKLSTSLLLSTSYVISAVFLHKSYAAASNTEDYDAIVFHDDVINSALLAFALLALCAGNSRWSVNSPTKASGAEPWCLFFICAWINGWVNNREAGDLRRNRVHYDVTLMSWYEYFTNQY